MCGALLGEVIDKEPIGELGSSLGTKSFPLALMKNVGDKHDRRITLLHCISRTINHNK